MCLQQDQHSTCERVYGHVEEGRRRQRRRRAPQWRVSVSLPTAGDTVATARHPAHRAPLAGLSRLR